jgi:hypothetical protein
MGRPMQTRSDELSYGTAIAPLAGMAAQILLVALFALFFATLAMSTVTVVKRFVDQARGHAPT